MRCITVSGESQPILPLGVGELVVLGALQVSEEMLDSEPMLGTRVLAETTKEAHSLCNVRPSHGAEVLEGANGTEIWHIAHKLNLLTVLGTHRLGELGARDKGSGDRVAVLHAIALEHVNDVLALGEGDEVVGAVLGDLNTKQELEGARVSSSSYACKVNLRQMGSRVSGLPEMALSVFGF